MQFNRHQLWIISAAALVFALLFGVQQSLALFIGLLNTSTGLGIVMLSHQIGGFLGAWIGGKLFEATGSYDSMWYIDFVLAIGAALIHLPIREAQKAPIPAAA